MVGLAVQLENCIFLVSEASDLILTGNPSRKEFKESFSNKLRDIYLAI